MQFGAIVYTASQARDYYNKRLTDGPDVVHKRSLAFEADYLHSIVVHPSVSQAMFKPNEYQQKVMQMYPKGLGSLDVVLWYESKPFKNAQV